MQDLSWKFGAETKKQLIVIKSISEKFLNCTIGICGYFGLVS